MYIEIVRSIRIYIYYIPGTVTLSECQTRIVVFQKVPFIRCAIENSGIAYLKTSKRSETGMRLRLN